MLWHLTFLGITVGEQLKDESYWKDPVTGHVNDEGHRLAEEYKTKKIIVNPPQENGLCHICFNEQTGKGQKLITIAVLHRLSNKPATEVSVCTVCDGGLYEIALKNRGQDQ